MTPRLTPRRSIAALALFCLPAAAAEPAPAATAADLRGLVATGRAQQATALAEQIGRSPGDGRAGAELAMLQGAAWQERARQASDPAERAQATDRARAAYQQALGLAPESSAILNNLALLEAAAGNDEAARGYFERAVRPSVLSYPASAFASQPDPRRPGYLLNYARYLQARDPAAAASAAMQAVKLAPTDAAAGRLLATLLARQGASALAPFLSGELDAGRTTFVLDTSLALLAAPDGAPAGSGEALLPAAAAAICADPVLLGTGPGPEALGRLAGLAAGPGPLADAARQLQSTLTEPPPGLAALGWWNDGSATGLRKYPTRKTVLRSLLYGLGSQRMKTAPGQAARWLRLAIDAGDQGPDPDAFVRLVELYVQTGQRPQLGELMSRYQYELFSEKSTAYMRQDWPQIYKLHLALGTTYAYLGQWDNPSNPIQSARFQLEHAKLAADSGNAVAQRKGQPQTLALPAQSVQQLAGYYVAKGEAPKAAALQLDAARQLKEAARPNESRAVLEKIEPGALKSAGPGAQVRYDGLKREVDGALRSGGY